MPFTWEIEGFDKPTKSLSNIPSEILAYDQNPMSTPVKHHFSPDARLEDIPQEIIEGAQANN